MAKYHEEHADGGLVTAVEPGSLQAGELQLAQNAVYRPDSSAIQPFGWRKPILDSPPPDQASPSIQWIDQIESKPIYDQRSHLLVKSDNQFFYSKKLPGYEQESFVRFGDTSSQDVFSVWYEDHRGLTFNGSMFISGNNPKIVSIMRSISPDPIMISHGMQAIGGGFVMETVSEAGTWENGLINYYFYWVTEYDQLRDLESPANHWAIGVQITDPAAQQVKATIRYGTEYYTQIRNPNATHWRIYRAGSTDGSSTANPWPLGGERVYCTWTEGEGYDIPIPSTPSQMVVHDTGKLSSITYEALVIQEGLLTSAVEINTPPMGWSVAGVFNDSLVIDNTNFMGRINYSYPGKPHSFPAINWLDMASGAAERITAIYSLGNVLIVGTNRKVWRVNYLPRASDPIFDRTRVKDIIASDHGIVSKRGAAIFSLDGLQQRLAYISESGLYMTDGVVTSKLSTDLDWGNIFNAENLGDAILLNVESLQCLVLYTSYSQDTFDKLYLFSYAKRHLKGDRLKATGPINLGGRSAFYSHQDRMLYTGSDDGFIYQEDRQTPDQGQPVDAEGMHLQGRFIYLAGKQNEAMVQRIYAATRETPLSTTTTSGYMGMSRLGIIKRKSGENDDSHEEVSRELSPGTFWKGRKQTVSEGIAFEYRGFAPLEFVGFDHQPVRGLG